MKHPVLVIIGMAFAIAALIFGGFLSRARGHVRYAHQETLWKWLVIASWILYGVFMILEMLVA